MRHPDDALTVARRALELGFTSTVGILHDHDGQLQPLAPDHMPSSGPSGPIKRCSLSLVRPLPAKHLAWAAQSWRCRAGSRFLYICEDGLVHYCSQQRGRPGIPLDRYTREDLEREAAREKPCAPYCTISCVHQTAMLDGFRESPRQVLREMIAARQERNPGYRPPPFLDALTWMFLDGPVNRLLGKVALRLLKARP